MRSTPVAVAAPHSARPSLQNQFGPCGTKARVAKEQITLSHVTHSPSAAFAYVLLYWKHSHRRTHTRFGNIRVLFGGSAASRCTLVMGSNHIFFSLVLQCRFVLLCVKNWLCSASSVPFFPFRFFFHLLFFFGCFFAFFAFFLRCIRGCSRCGRFGGGGSECVRIVREGSIVRGSGSGSRGGRRGSEWRKYQYYFSSRVLAFIFRGKRAFL